VAQHHDPSRPPAHDQRIGGFTTDAYRITVGHIDSYPHRRRLPWEAARQHHVRMTRHGPPPHKIGTWTVARPLDIEKCRETGRTNESIRELDFPPPQSGTGRLLSSHVTAWRRPAPRPGRAQLRCRGKLVPFRDGNQRHSAPRPHVNHCGEARSHREMTASPTTDKPAQNSTSNAMHSLLLTNHSSTVCSQVRIRPGHHCCHEYAMASAPSRSRSRVCWPWSR
jgi:hypothetical protein